MRREFDHGDALTWKNTLLLRSGYTAGTEGSK
jgi:hypothetical protein